jgi:hypothetical protein
MTKKQNLAKPGAPKPFSIAEYEKQRRAIIERGCAELWVDEAELFRRVRGQLRDISRQFQSQRQPERGDTSPTKPQI